MVGRITPALLLATTCVGSMSLAAKPRLRRPVALTISPDGERLYVANRRSGSVSVVDPVKQRVVGEIDLGGRPSAMTLLAGGRHLLVTDEQRHRLVLLSGARGEWKVAARLKVAPYPVDVVTGRRGKRCYVSSLWSQAVTVVDVRPNATAKLSVAKTIRIPFPPRKICLAKDDARLIVAGSFEGMIGTIDTRRNALLVVKNVPGHNIRGLALGADGKRLLIAQQSLNSLAHSTLDDVHWGNMMVNVLYSFSLEDVYDPRAELLKDRLATHLGTPEYGAGDPGPIAVRRGRLAIALSGVNQVVVSRGLSDPLAPVSVGRQPAALAFSPDGKRVFTADTLSDSVSIIDAVRAKLLARISLGRQPKLTPAERGEQLFFDARLSHDGWMSCNSCHTDGHSNGLLNDNLSDGSFGAPKRVLSLLGVAQTGPWAWNGTVKGLDRQVRNSVTKTMQGEAPTDEQVADLVAFLQTLKPPPPPSRFGERPHAAAIKAGRRLFSTFNCNRCHSPPSYTSKAAYDVGLTDAAGNKRFNPPSLRGVGWRRALFHDGRARSLKDVFARFRHQLPRALSKSELDELIAFLRSL